MPDRILTTHVGSLPRPADVSDMLFARERGEVVDQATFEQTVARAVVDVVGSQRRAGVDIPSDGEMSKISYATYVGERLSGFSGDSPRRTPADLLLVPNLGKRLSAGNKVPSYRRPCCTGEIGWKDRGPLEADLARFRVALELHGYERGFLNAAAPGVIALFQPNRHYATEDAYLEALSLAMRDEFEAIVAAGFDVQIDSPDLALGRHMMYADLDDDGFVRAMGAHIAALNAALAFVPQARIRLHLCWGNYEGPHTRDIAMAKILPTVLGVRFGALSFEAANPRHAHEWRVWRDIALPEDRVIIPGMLDSSTNYVEHPDLVAERLLRFADVVGRERVIAGSDCGFSTFAGFGVIDPDIVWMKLESLARGAERASKVLWG